MQRRGAAAVLMATVAAAAMVSGVSAKKVTLNVMMWDATASYDKPTFDAFEKSHPNIKLKVIRGMDEKFMAMKASGLPVDVFFNYSVYGWTNYANNGLFVDLTPYVNRDKKDFPKDTLPLVFNSLKFGSKLFGLAHHAYGATAITYSKKLLDESGLPEPPSSWEDKSWTWERMVEYAQKMTRADSNGKYKTVGFDTFDADNLIQFAWSFGGDWYPKEAYKTGYATKSAINSAENAKAYQALRDLRFKYKVRPGAETPGYSSAGWPDLLQGKAGMWCLPLEAWSAPQAKTKPLSKLGLAPMPIVPGVGRVGGFGWLGGLAMCSGTKYANEAWEFIKWMVVDAATINTPWPGSGARKSTWINWFKKSDNIYIIDSKAEKVMEGALENYRAFPRCQILGADQFWKIAAPQLGAYLSSKNSGSVQEVLAKIARDADKELARVSMRAGRTKK